MSHALARNARSLARSEDGFTLIELLVVILIIGVLAAVAIPSFLGQRVKGQDACAKAMAKEMFTATKAYQTEHDSLAGLTLDDLHETEASITTSGGANDCVAAAVGAGSNSGDCDASTVPGQITFCVSSTSASGSRFTLSEIVGGDIYRGCVVGSGEQVPHGGCRGSSGTSGTW